jgi:hypothetical protein
MKTSTVYATAVALVGLLGPVGTDAVQSRPQPPKSPRLYVFDCGTLEGDPARFNFTREEWPQATCRSPAISLSMRTAR